MAFRIAELFVEWTMKGVEAFQKAIETAHTSIAKLSAGANAVGQQAEAAFNKLNGTVGGFVRQGIAASAMGDVLNFQLQRLALSIAGLFGPELNKIIGLIERFTNYLNSLSAEQRSFIAHMIEGAAAGLLIAKVMPMIFAGVQMVTSGVMGLAGALGILDVETGGLLPLLGALVSAFLGVAVGTEVGRGAFGDLFDTIKPVLAVLQNAFSGVMESLGPLFSAITDLASAFMPIIEAVIEVAAALAEVLIPAVAAIVELLRPFLALLGLIAKVVAGVLVPVFKVLAAIVTAVAKAIAFITGRKYDTEEKAGKKVDENRGSLARKTSGPEALGAAFDRIAKASIAIGGAGGAAGKAGKSPEEQQVDTLAAIKKEQEKTNALLARAHPFLLGV